MRHVGFTGTEHEVPAEQADSLWGYLGTLRPFVLHHGDCINADERAHGIALRLGQRVHLHPPDNPSKRAFCEGWTWCDAELPYLERNENIVRITTELVACPREYEMVVRSGVWSTVRKARKLRRPVTIIWPNGERSAWI